MDLFQKLRQRIHLELKKKKSQQSAHSCVDICFMCVCVCVCAGPVTRSCRAAEETGGAGEEGCRARPPGERNAVAQCFRRSASDSDMQPQISTVTTAKNLTLTAGSCIFFCCLAFNDLYIGLHSVARASLHLCTIIHFQ